MDIDFTTGAYLVKLPENHELIFAIYTCIVYVCTHMGIDIVIFVSLKLMFEMLSVHWEGELEPPTFGFITNADIDIDVDIDKT